MMELNLLNGMIKTKGWTGIMFVICDNTFVYVD